MASMTIPVRAQVTVIVVGTRRQAERLALGLPHFRVLDARLRRPRRRTFRPTGGWVPSPGLVRAGDGEPEHVAPPERG